MHVGDVMQRCSHGIYLPKWATDGANPYCSGCSNFGTVVDAKEVVLPRSSSDPLTNADHIRANGFAGGCPACGTVAYVRVKEMDGDTNRECAECGTKYKTRKTVHQQAKLLLAEMEQQEWMA
jgi:Zn ribbon nucleic-acid-binding protein